MVCETILIIGLILQLPCWNGGFSDVCCSLPGMAVGNLDGPSWSALALEMDRRWIARKSAWIFAWIFPHKIWHFRKWHSSTYLGKKLHIFGASSVGAPPPPSFARKGTSLLGRWSSWGSRDAQNQRLWWCVLAIQIFDWQKFVDGCTRSQENEDHEDVMIWDFLLMNVFLVIFYILLRRWLMFNVGWQHGWFSLPWTMHYASTI